MKHTILALALVGAFGVAQAQSSVTIYGTLDEGITKRSDTTLAIGKRDNNKLGFKGVEDLGNGLKALFQLEMRYESDTGTVESGSRPLFQGQSRVGLQGDFGMVRLGRGTTALIDAVDLVDPFYGLSSTEGFKTDLAVAGYTSDPLSPAGNSGNRFSNALFYNSPEYMGFQFNATVATKEANGGPALVGRGTTALPQYAANAEASVNPYSVSAIYKNGPALFILATERNAVESKLISAGAAVNATQELKLTALYARQDQGHTKLTNPKTKAWVVGANYTIGVGRVLAGYGQKSPDGVVKTKETSVGYEYNLSKRTYLYVDLSNKKTASSIRYYNLGVHHNF
ncbi:MAG TPA: porin [Telluria sp.]|nr:porin [Telluria sp.]